MAAKIAPKFVFGYYSVEDIEQEAFILALDALPAYDGSSPLENFLYVHIKNRLVNFKRDNYMRQDLAESTAKVKKSLMYPQNIHGVSQSIQYDSDITQVVCNGEIREKINRRLHAVYREDYLRLLDGVSIPKHRRHKLLDTIIMIIHHEDGTIFEGRD